MPTPLLALLENDALRLEFDPAGGTLTTITNKLTGELIAVEGDAFAVETAAWRLDQAQMRQVEWSLTREAAHVLCTHPSLQVEVAYDLRPGDHFFQKRMAIHFVQAADLTRIILSRPTFSAAGLQIVGYRHPDFDWIIDYVKVKHGSALWRPADCEPTRTFFGRSAAGGFFTGVEMPFDNSSFEQHTLTLGYQPSLKMAQGQRLKGETMYFGVYRRDESDAQAAAWKPVAPAVLVGASSGDKSDHASAASAKPGLADHAPAASAKPLPLPSESKAMTAMTCAILGPPRHGLMAFACAWHCQMEQDALDTPAKLQAQLQSLEFISACGLDGLSDSHPWGGESALMARLGPHDAYLPTPATRQFLQRAKELGLKVTQWPTMNNTHPWRDYGRPLRMDQPSWLRGVEGEALVRAAVDDFRHQLANCFACQPFFDWLEHLILDQVLAGGDYESWCMDGDFWGTGAYYHNILPVTCLAENHEHLPGDSNYACQSRLNQLIAAVRQRHRNIYIIMCRPPMDLGIWAQRNVDACFTLLESGTAGSNIAAGNEVRTSSRIRVHHHFYPHWLDQSLLFPSYASEPYPAWPKEHIDYLMLSALSSSPNLLLYLPTRTGIPQSSRQEIRFWLDWGRQVTPYLMRRVDLPDWPAPGRVDGSAHLLGDHGLIFLFNPDSRKRTVVFTLNQQGTGFTGTAPTTLRQVYPPRTGSQNVREGDKIQWQVPAESALVLQVGSAPDMAALFKLPYPAAAQA